MSYPKIPDLNSIVSQITEYVRLKAEYGNQNLDSYLADLEQTLKGSLEQLKNLPEDSELAAREPNSLEEIHRLRPDGPRKLWVERCTIFGGSFNYGNISIVKMCVRL